jgi:hypothetical protein
MDAHRCSLAACYQLPETPRPVGRVPAMRSAKSLISGFGVAVSLIGAVACAFFITAALVAFHGSFSVADDYPPQSTVLVANAKHDRPIVISVARQPRVRPAVAGPAPVSAAAPLIATVSVSKTILTSHQTKASVPSTPAVVGPSKATQTTTTPSATAPLANATAGLANALGTVVADATSSLGTTVAPVSPALGGTVHGLGTGLANGVVALGNAVAGLVTALGTHPAAP